MDIGTAPRKGTPPLSSPKLSTAPDRSLSGSRETNENEQPLDQKPMIKNFMSPTISASFKASVPIRKKILAERNGISSSCEILPHKSSNLGSKTSPLNSISHSSEKLPISSYNYASKSENDQEKNSVVDYSYKPYDPLTNDLGPRPKYLRFQPNRRRGTLLAQERCSLDPHKSNDDQGPLQQPQDSTNLSEKYNLEPENEEDMEDSVEDDEEMEEVVDREWSLKGLSKLLLLLVVFFLSGTNLSSRNSMVTSDTRNMIHKNIFEAVFHEIYGSGSVYLDQPEYSQSSLLEWSQREALDAVEFVEDIVGFLKVESAEMQTITEPQEGLSADIDIDQDSTEVEVTQNVHGDEEDKTMLTAAGEVTCSTEVDEEEVEGSDEQLQKDPSMEDQIPLNLQVLLKDEEEVEGSDEQLQKDPNMEDQIPLNLQVLLKDEEEVEGSDEQLQKDPNMEDQIPLNLEVLLDDFSSTCAAHSSYKFEQAGTDNKVEQVESISQEHAGGEEISETVSKGAEEIDTDFKISTVIGPNNIVIIIVLSASSVLLVASLVIIYVTRKPKAFIETPQAGILNHPVIASVEGEFLERKTETSIIKVSSLHERLNEPSETLRNSHLERTPAIGSTTQALFLCRPKKEASTEISHISAPKIELLGEMMVGEVSSSLRSCVRKNSMTGAEGSNTNLSKGYLPPAQPSVVDHSITDSPSYGSFIAEKILKKKAENDGEEVKKVVLTTPVRRSSRIRDRAGIGMSP